MLLILVKVEHGCFNQFTLDWLFHLDGSLICRDLICLNNCDFLDVVDKLLMKIFTVNKRLS